MEAITSPHQLKHSTRICATLEKINGLLQLLILSLLTRLFFSPIAQLTGQCQILNSKVQLICECSGFSGPPEPIVAIGFSSCMFCAIVAALFLVRKINFMFGEKFANFNELHHKKSFVSFTES
jgi:hypothetical protein